MSIYIVIFTLLIGVPIFLGVVYLIRNVQARRRNAPGVHGRDPAPPPRGRNADPVTLDRSPQMPHRPDATS